MTEHRWGTGGAPTHPVVPSVDGSSYADVVAESQPSSRRTKDGRTWRVGDGTESCWIAQGTTHGRAITSAIPPVFEAYATLELAGTPGAGGSWSASADDLQEQIRQDAALIVVLERHTSKTDPWWLGYLETGIGAETIFYDVPPVKLYADWPYVLVEAGPEQAARWRERDLWKGVLPDLMFPVGRQWLVSTLWDDQWRCIGGSRRLIDGLLDHPDLHPRARSVHVGDEDATPPGHTSI